METLNLWLKKSTRLGKTTRVARWTSKSDVPLGHGHPEQPPQTGALYGAYRQTGVRASRTPIHIQHHAGRTFLRRPPAGDPCRPPPSTIGQDSSAKSPALPFDEAAGASLRGGEGRVGSARGTPAGRRRSEDRVNSAGPRPHRSHRQRQAFSENPRPLRRKLGSKNKHDKPKHTQPPQTSSSSSPISTIRRSPDAMATPWSKRPTSTASQHAAPASLRFTAPPPSASRPACPSSLAASPTKTKSGQTTRPSTRPFRRTPTRPRRGRIPAGTDRPYALQRAGPIARLRRNAR